MQPDSALPDNSVFDDAVAAETCRAALQLLQAGQGDAQALVEQVLNARPDFLPAHCLRAAGLVMASCDEALPALADTLRTAGLFAAAAGPRERAHLAAAQAWLDKDMRKSLHLYGEIAERDPHDTLALRVAHFGDLQWGRTDMLRDRIARALQHWHTGEPGYGHVLAMYAFGLAEASEAAAADAVGRQALCFEPQQAGAVHAVAHALEMQGRSADGAAWLAGTRAIWSASPSFAVHLWWHEALFLLDQGHLNRVLRILDRRLMSAAAPDTATLVDASALLWRLHLQGLDVAQRWQRIADDWERHRCAGLRPFNDVHAMLAFVATRRDARARCLLDALRRFARRAPDLHAAVYDAALPVCRALIAFGQERYTAAMQQLQAQRRLVRGCGGSRAQCDLLHLTWLEAALRGGRPELAQQLLDERIASRPASQQNDSLRERIARARSCGRTTLRRLSSAASTTYKRLHAGYTCAMHRRKADTGAGQTASHVEIPVAIPVPGRQGHSTGPTASNVRVAASSTSRS